MSQKSILLRRSAALALALALGLVSASAFAQSQVSLFGMADAGVTVTNNAGGAAHTLMQDSVWTPTLWGIRGNEDLGGGYHTVFELLSQFSLDTGAVLGQEFDRSAYVGLEKNGLGRLTFGQQYNLLADFLLFPPTAIDATFTYGGLFNMRAGPFAALGGPTGALDFDQVAGTTRIPDSVKFTSASFGGLRVGALYGFNHQTADSPTAQNKTTGLAADYQSGNFRAAVAYNDTRYAAINNGQDGLRTLGAGLGYHFGALDATALYTNTKNTFTGGVVQAVQLGGLYAFNATWRWGGNIQYLSGNAPLSHNKAVQLTTVVQYSFSKRTTLYVEAAYQRTGGDVPGQHDAAIGGMTPSSNDRQLVGRIGIQTFF